MRMIFTLPKTAFKAILIFSFVVVARPAHAQICQSPGLIIYGLTNTGGIYPINVSTGAVGTAVKNTSYGGNAVNKANCLAYNNVNGRFYYFKRNVGSSPQEFVCYDPALNTVTVLAASTCSAEAHTGCITADGKGYYTIDTNGELDYYNIQTNTWTNITSNFKDQSNTDVTAVIKSQSAGDIAFDGLGNLWIVTSNASNYGMYKLMAPVPTTATATVNVKRIISPTTATPSGNNIAGIAFNPSGQIFLSTLNDDRLYRLENNLTTTYLATFSVTNVGNDLTSCAFPLGVLPVTWVSFNAIRSGDDLSILTWEAIEEGTVDYTVQHSTDGQNWEDLALIHQQYRNTEVHKYTYAHRVAAAGKHYYRVKMNNDAKNMTSTAVKTLEFSGPALSLSVWPNPATDQVQVKSIQANIEKIRVFDLSGKMVLEKKTSGMAVSLSLNGLRKGTYIINSLLADGSSANQKMVKQ